MVERALRRIEADLDRISSEEPIDAEAVRIAARRIGAQAEMLERGLE